jgi:hypothetical protein
VNESAGRSDQAAARSVLLTGVVGGRKWAYRAEKPIGGYRLSCSRNAR